MDSRELLIHPLAARALLADLERRQSWVHLTPGLCPPHSEEEKQLVKEEGERLGCKWALVSKWTSFVAIDEPYVTEGERDGFIDSEDPVIPVETEWDLLTSRDLSHQAAGPILPPIVADIEVESAAGEPGDSDPSDSENGDECESVAEVGSDHDDDNSDNSRGAGGALGAGGTSRANGQGSSDGNSGSGNAGRPSGLENQHQSGGGGPGNAPSHGGSSFNNAAGSGASGQSSSSHRVSYGSLAASRPQSQAAMKISFLPAPFGSSLKGRQDFRLPLQKVTTSQVHSPNR